MIIFIINNIQRLEVLNILPSKKICLIKSSKLNKLSVLKDKYIKRGDKFIEIEIVFFLYKSWI